jgi:hypothetical protein
LASTRGKKTLAFSPQDKDFFLSHTDEVGSIGNSLGARTRATRCAVRVTGPVTAQGHIEHKRMLVEMAAHVACVGAPEANGLAPRSRVRRLGGDVRRDLVAREAPDRDAV